MAANWELVGVRDEPDGRVLFELWLLPFAMGHRLRQRSAGRAKPVSPEADVTARVTAKVGLALRRIMPFGGCGAAVLYGCAAPNPDLGCARARRDRLQLARPADPLGELLQVPRPRSGVARGGLAARRRRARDGRAAGDAGQVRDRARRSRAQRARAAYPRDERRRAHAARVDAQDALAAADRDPRAMDRRRRASTGRTGRSSRRSARRSRRRRSRRAPRTTSIGSCSRRLEREGLAPSPRSRQGNADQPRDARR